MTIIEPGTDATGVDRRQLLRRAGLVATGVVAAGVATTAVASPASADDDLGSGPTGSWLLTSADPSGFPVPGAWIFHPGGAMTEQNLVPANIVLWGSWARTSRNGFRYTMWGGVPGEDGGPGVLFRVNGTGKVERGVLTTPWTAAFVDPSTMVDLFTFPGSSTGRRIEA